MSRLFLLLLFLSGIAVSAQDEKESILPPHERAVKMTYVMAEELSLTDLQKDQVYNINYQMLKAQEKAEKSVEEIQEEYYEALKEVLTEKQHNMFIEQQHEPTEYPSEKNDGLSIDNEAPEGSGHEH